jgi:hypothetical protein
MISPKEKAQELINKYLDIDMGIQDDGYLSMKVRNAQKCALIAVIETKLAFVKISNWEQAEYWRGVERELEKRLEKSEIESL